MNDRLKSLREEIRGLVKAEDPTAVARAEKLVEEFPNESQAWFFLAYVRASYEDLDGSVTAMTRVIETFPPNPAAFFFRGHYEHNRGDLQAALANFTQGINLAKQTGIDLYLECLYFMRADVLVGLGKKAEAQADLAHVRDDHVEWTTELRTKADILADCEE